ncbi:MAG: hypothetical protein IPP71_23535 [Bacteroidetes bacterium]|nr:hypothetical protein [Bacteroidota bacterium]
MKNFRKKLFVIGMALVMLVSTLGIAQVSHICKMALAGKENAACKSFSADKHACCQKTTSDIAEKLPFEPECCKDVVKIYVIKVVTTLTKTSKFSILI